ncbi:hypothetical protein CLOP_g7086 [Closterium sp. NIES-67]|nr:hypothetical protein CLOP_g7086 [Closterium sp. NIES-67]
MALPPDSAVPPIPLPRDGASADGLLDVLGAEVTVALLACLDAPSLARCTAVSRSWRRLASDDTLWLPLCSCLWRCKAFVPRRFKALLESPPRRAASRHDATVARVLSPSRTAAVRPCAGDGAGGRRVDEDADADTNCETMLFVRRGAYPATERATDADSDIDAQVPEPFSWAAMYRQSLSEGAREGILAEELCSVTWSFRFKHMDLPWIRNHPFWLNLPPLLRRFHADGSVASGTHNDPIFGSHENIWRFVPRSPAPRPAAAPAAPTAAAAAAAAAGDGARSGAGGQGSSEGARSNVEGGWEEARAGPGEREDGGVLRERGASSTCATGTPTSLHAAMAPAPAAAAAAAAAATTPVPSLRVRINHWPALTVVRRADWGWDMANEYVIYCSLPPPSP